MFKILFSRCLFSTQLVVISYRKQKVVKMSKKEWADNKEIQILQEYLRIPSVHSDKGRINYGK